MKNSAPATPLEKILRYGAHAWLFALIFSTFMAEALALALIGAWLGLRRRQRTPLDFFILLFLGIRLLTIVTAIAPATSMHALRKIPFLLVYFPVAHLAQRLGAGEIHKLLRTLIIAGLAASCVGLLRTLLTPVWRLASTTSGATTLATFLAVTFSLALTLILRNELQPARRWLSGCAMMLLALAFTRCRAPWLATLFVSGFMIKPVSRGVLTLGAGAIVILLLVPGFGMRHAEVLHWPPDFGDRPIIWKAGWEAATQYPLLGYGPESFALVFQSRQELKDQRAGAWHNFALQLLVESGALGLVVFLALVLQAFRLTQNGFQTKLFLFDKKP
ncbi:MAG: O-antigen ligase family protein, partial [candidate division KSB1 bacterium]